MSVSLEFTREPGSEVAEVQEALNGRVFWSPERRPIRADAPYGDMKYCTWTKDQTIPKSQSISYINPKFNIVSFGPTKNFWASRSKVTWARPPPSRLRTSLGREPTLGLCLSVKRLVWLYLLFLPKQQCDCLERYGKQKQRDFLSILYILGGNWYPFCFIFWGQLISFLFYILRVTDILSMGSIMIRDETSLAHT